MFSKKIILLTLSLLPQIAAAGSLTSGDLIRCPHESGGAKTGCTTDVKVWKEAELSDFAVKYNYICRKIFSNALPAFAATSVPTSTSPVSISEGTNKQIVIREATELHFGFTGSSAVSLSSDCSVTVASVSVTPAESRIQALRAEAKRLTDLLLVQGPNYKAIVDNARLMDIYTIPQLKGMVIAMQNILNLTLEQALGESGSQPADYSLNYASWDQFDAFQQGLIVFDSASSSYAVKVNVTQHPYYFDAKDTLPVIPSILAQLSSIKNATRLKENAAAGGYVIPDAAAALKALNELIDAATAFKKKVEAITNRLSAELAALESSKTAATPAKSPENKP